MEKKSAGFSKLAVIIPTHNRKKELKNLLDQIDNQKVKGNYSITTVVVVDGSTDGTLEMLEIYYPNIQIVHGDGNWWYTKSMNEGFKYAVENINPNYILTLNDDIELAEDYFDEMQKTIRKNDDKTIVGSLGVTKTKPYKIVTSGNSYKYKMLGLYKHHLPFLSEVKPNELTGMYPSITLPGRGILIPVPILKELNGFDEKFLQYHSDGDFTLRATKKGYSVKINWNMKIYVYIEKTNNTASFLNKNILVLIRNYFNPVSRYYLPDKIRFIWRHSYILMFPLKFGLFIFLSILNLYRKKKV